MNPDIRPLFDALPAPDESASSSLRDRTASVLRPLGALARLDEVAIWLAGWQRTASPEVGSPATVVFVADHGVAQEGVSAYPAAVTEAMLRALQGGVATAAAMARAIGATLDVVDVGVGRPTGNLATEPALTEERFRECLDAGRHAVTALDADLLVLGEMGIANTTAAAAVSAALFGGLTELWVGRGTGIDDATFARKLAVVEAARRRIDDVTDPFEILRHVGGAELAAIAGAALEARRRSLPVVLDGFVVTAAVAALGVAQPGALDHCLAGHCSGEAGHRLLLDKLGMSPLLDLGLRLGEGSGALAAVPLVALAATAVTDVATFDEWGLTR
jgi:nicotinate-nucleotide--dimethylbenzimidazole phosphoribosyltransferase